MNSARNIPSIDRAMIRQNTSDWSTVQISRIRDARGRKPTLALLNTPYRGCSHRTIPCRECYLDRGGYLSRTRPGMSGYGGSLMARATGTVLGLFNLKTSWWRRWPP